MQLTPANWAFAEDATGSPATDGTVEAWTSFDADTARGYGHLRLRLRKG
jgi:putative flavoprotein involved in K+ transport